MHVTVETRGEFTRGMTVCDTRGFRSGDPLVDITHEFLFEPLPKGEAPNVEVALELDAQRFDQVLLETLELYS